MMVYQEGKDHRVNLVNKDVMVKTANLEHKVEVDWTVSLDQKEMKDRVEHQVLVVFLEAKGPKDQLVCLVYPVDKVLVEDQVKLSIIKFL